MKTTVITPAKKTKTNERNILKHNFLTRQYDKLLAEYSIGVIGYGAISVLGQSCYASIAAMFILKNPNMVSRPIQMVQLFLVTVCCIGFNAMFISVQKPRTQVNVLIASVIVSTVFLCSNIF